MAEDERCEECRFGDRVRDTVQCHRYPPKSTAMKDDLSRFPIMYLHDWCGEFQRNTQQFQKRANRYG
jgi:hypothetical protein